MEDFLVKKKIQIIVMAFMVVLLQVLPMPSLIVSAAETETPTTQEETAPAVETEEIQDENNEQAEEAVETTEETIVEESEVVEVEPEAEAEPATEEEPKAEETTTESNETNGTPSEDEVVEKKEPVSTESVEVAPAKVELQAAQPEPRSLETRTLYGIALQAPTKIYPTTSTNVEPLKDYAIGSKLKYETYNANWHIATVYINGEPKTGYIKATDVENITANQETLHGIGVANPTKVYSKAATSSNVWKDYPQGTVLKYQTLTSGWYEATVYVSGKARTGYIKKSDVENIQERQVTLNGVAKQNSTKIYSKASANSSILKDYPQGTILKYESFTANWYKAKVYIRGHATTGYISANDVSTINDNQQQDLRGVALRSPVNIYSGVSTNLGVIKSYPIGSILQYKSFIDGWYEAKVYVNGKPKTGYIHAGHVENATQSPEVQEVLAKVKVNVYKKADRGSGILKDYDRNSVLKVTTFTSNWYEATVYVKGKKYTGYISKDDVNTTFINYTTYNYSVNHMIDKQMGQAAPLADRWQDYGYVRSDGVRVDNANNPTSGTITKLEWNVREDANLNSHALGMLIKDAEVKILDKKLEPQGNYYWYKIEYKKQWFNAKREHVSNYANPTKFEIGSRESLQFLVLSQSAGLNASEVNERILKGKEILDGKGSYFIEAARTHNINEIYLISHALLETGHGTSDLANGVLVSKVDGQAVEPRVVYNIYGIGAIDKCPEGTGCPLKYGSERAYKEGWFSPEAAIVGGAQFISEDYIHAGQDTLYKMRWNPAAPATHQYAADVAWATKQTYSIYNLYSLLDSYKMIFDVPKFQ